MSYSRLDSDDHRTSSNRGDDIELQPRKTEQRTIDSEEESDDDEHHVLYTKEDVKRVVKRFDRYLVSFLALLYMLSFLDRSNIGNVCLWKLLRNDEECPLIHCD